MGGTGSGHPSWKGRKETVEACTELDVRSWRRDGYLGKRPVRMTVTWTRNGEQIAAIGVTASRDAVRLTYETWREQDKSDRKTYGYTVPVEWTACNFGGERPWFVCPGGFEGRVCNRRVAKLYLRSHLFLCRHCHGLTYVSRQTGKNDQALRKCRKIRQQLGGSADMTTPFPPKPKGMHHQTYLKLLWEHDRAEQRYLASLIAFLDRINPAMSRLRKW